MILSLVAALAFSAPIDDPKVTYQNPGARLEVAAQELTQKTGVSIQVSNTLAGQVITVDCKDRLLSELREQIAFVSSGKWTEESGGWVLSLDEAKVKADLAKEQEIRLQQYQLGIQRLKDVAEGTQGRPAGDKIDEIYNAVMGMRQLDEQARKGGGEPIELPDISMPYDPFGAEAATTKVIELLDLNLLATLPLNRRTVLSSNPTSLQRPLPRNAAQEYQRLMVQVAQRRDHAKRALEARGVKWDEVLRVLSDNAAANGAPWTIEIFPTEKSCNVGIRSSASNSSYNIVGISFEVPDQEDQVGSQSIRLSKAADAISVLVGSGGLPAGTEVRTKLAETPEVFDPESQDWIGFGPGRLVLELATKASKPVVAVIPDSMIQECSAATVSLASATSLLKGAMAFSEQGGWIRWKPHMANAARQGRENRFAMGSALRTWRDAGYLNLDAMASFRANTTRIPMGIANGLQIGVLQIPYSGGFDFLPVYGSLTPDQKRSLWESRPVPASALSPKAQGALAYSAFWGQEPGVVEIESAQSESELETADGPVNPLEPTSLLPNGIPRNACLETSDITSRDVLMGDNGDAYGLEELVGVLLQKRHPERYPTGSDESLPKSYRRAKQTSVWIKLRVGERMSFSGYLEDVARPTGEAFSLDSMPADLKQQLDQLMKDMERAMTRYWSGGAKQGDPPPILGPRN